MSGSKLPEGWVSEPLCNVSKIIRGVSFNKADWSQTPEPGFVAFLRAGNIDSAILLHDDLQWVRRTIVSDDQMLRYGDLIICTSSGSPKVVGKTGLLKEEWNGTVGAFIGIIRPHGVEPSWLQSWFRSRSFLQWRDSRAQGANIQNLRLSEILQLQISLPPLPEQLRIADAIDTAMTEAAAAARAAKAQAVQIVELVRTYVDGLISNLVDSEGTLPLEQLAPGRDAFRDGPFGSNLKSSHYADHGARVVRLQNIGEGVFLNHNKAFVTLTHFASINNHATVAGDVIVAALGDGVRPAGRACVLPELSTPAVVKADCFRVRLPHETLRPEFVALAINSRFVRSQLTGQLRGATRPRVNLGMLRQVAFPRASVEQQDAVVHAVCEIQGEVTRAETALAAQQAAIQALPSAILTAAFQGDL